MTSGPSSADHTTSICSDHVGGARCGDDDGAPNGTPEPLPALHTNLAHVYRQKVERLEQALNDPIASAAAVEALRSLVDAIVVHPGKEARRGQCGTTRRPYCLLHLAGDSPAASIQRARTAGPSMENSSSGEVVGSLVAGAAPPRVVNGKRMGWKTWRRPTLPRLETQYHGRWGFSRPSSGWDRVRAPRQSHQVVQSIRCRAGSGSGCCVLGACLMCVAC